MELKEINNEEEIIIYPSLFLRYLIPFYIFGFTVTLFFAFECSFDKEAIKIYSPLLILTFLISLIIRIRNIPDIIIKKDAFWTKYNSEIKWNDLLYIAVETLDQGDDGLVDYCYIYLKNYKKEDVKAEKFRILVKYIFRSFPDKFLLEGKYKVLQNIIAHKYVLTKEELNEQLKENYFKPIPEDEKIHLT